MLEVDPVEIELWTKQNEHARQEYYRSPGPHPEKWTRRDQDRVRSFRSLSPGQARDGLDQALQDLWQARYRVESQQRLINSLYRTIIELEIRVGDRDAEGRPVPGVQLRGPGDVPEGYGDLLGDLREDRGRRGEGKDTGEEEGTQWTA